MIRFKTIILFTASVLLIGMTEGAPMTFANDINSPQAPDTQITETASVSGDEDNNPMSYVMLGARGLCNFTVYNGSRILKVSNISCTGNATVQPWIKYWRYPGAKPLRNRMSSPKSSGSVSVSRPEGSVEHSRGVNRNG